MPHKNGPFHRKYVYKLMCRCCMLPFTERAMKATLLSDSSIKLYSTDIPFEGAIVTFGRTYKTGKCECQLQNTACAKCGVPFGYNVLKPCEECLSGCNNGHYFIFSDRAIVAEAVLNLESGDILRWGEIGEPPAASSNLSGRPLKNGFTVDFDEELQYIR